MILTIICSVKLSDFSLEKLYRSIVGAIGIELKCFGETFCLLSDFAFVKAKL